jgi:hypothetical protein
MGAIEEITLEESKVQFETNLFGAGTGNEGESQVLTNMSSFVMIYDD